MPLHHDNLFPVSITKYILSYRDIWNIVGGDLPQNNKGNKSTHKKQIRKSLGQLE